MIKQLLYIIFILLYFSISSCKNENQEQSNINYKEYKEPLEKVNTILIKKDADRIEKYYKRRKWDMKVSETGLYYCIYKNGTGKTAKSEQTVTINYAVSLLDGTLCYTSDSLGQKTFKLGYGGVELGLEQGLLLMRKGDKAHFIMPPYLAHGLIGDENRIPPRSIIVYDVELVDVK